MDSEPNQPYSSLALWRTAMVAGLIGSMMLLDSARDFKFRISFNQSRRTVAERNLRFSTGGTLLSSDSTKEALLPNSGSISSSSKLPRLGTLLVAPLPEPPLVMTDDVKQELRYLLLAQPRFIPAAQKRGSEYFPVMRQILEDEGIPPQLINLALIESGFNVKARSHKGAVGMWQFIRTTGQGYGLRIGTGEDQREDPILSTIAAARHLRDLYLYFDDWYLALAAYNAGMGAIDRARKRAGSECFWQIKRKGLIPSETARYVPRFIAVTMITEQRNKFVVENGKILASYACDQGGDEKLQFIS